MVSVAIVQDQVEIVKCPDLCDSQDRQEGWNISSLERWCALAFFAPAFARSFASEANRLRRFVVGVLGDEFALDGEGEDGFAEVGGGDGVGRVEEEIEVGRGGRVGKAGQRRAGERGVPRLPFLLLRLQPITQRHQLIHLRHDPLLLGEGWEGQTMPFKSPAGTLTNGWC